jgi:alpha-galactosidase
MIDSEFVLSKSCGQTVFCDVGILAFCVGFRGLRRSPQRNPILDATFGLRMQMNNSANNTITATLVSGVIRPHAVHSAKEWDLAAPVRFSTYWQGKNADPRLETEVRVLLSPTALYLRFVCHYRELFVFEESDPNGRRDHLWDRDVAEAFLQPPESFAKSEARRFYKEFEIAPNGMWIDLDISPSGLADLKSGMTRSVHVDEKNKIWTAELAIPMNSLTARFDPNATWRVNFYRVEGKTEPRKYMAWQPTMTAQPNFHVPERFGVLRFGK